MKKKWIAIVGVSLCLTGVISEAAQYWVCEGDSHMSGYGTSAGTNWPNVLSQLIATPSITNISLQGDTIENNVTAGDTLQRLTNSPGTGFAREVAIMSFGPNDLAQLNSVATVTTNLLKYINSVRSNSALTKVIGCTMLGLNFGLGGQEATVQQRWADVNTWIRTAGHGYSFVIDFAADSRLTNYTDTTWYQNDQVHPNDAGVGLMAKIAFTNLVQNGFTNETSVYYVDVNVSNDLTSGTTNTAPWKRCPGMVGFANSGYVHWTGDAFVFKGGVTWGSNQLPLTVAYSGASGQVDYYGVSNSYYTGGSWTMPIFDGQNALGQNAKIITSNDKSYFTIDSLHVMNAGNGVDASGEGIGIFNGSFLTIQNCWSDPNAEAAFTSSVSDGNYAHVYFNSNVITRAGRCTVYGNTGFVLDDFQMNDTVWYGCTNDAIGAGYHLDGLMVGDPTGGNVTSNSAPTMTNIKFQRNRFVGKWGESINNNGTAQYYSNGGTSNTLIANCVFSYENQTTASGGVLSPGFIALGKLDAGTIEIYNNTFSNDSIPLSTSVVSGISISTPKYGSLTIKNNTFSRLSRSIGYDAGLTNIVIDYNLYNPNASPNYLIAQSIANTYTYTTLAQCQSGGFETHSPATNSPLFKALSNGNVDSEDLSLTTNSTAIGAGVNLSSLFTTDILRVTRPASAAWTIGAFEGGSGGTGSTVTTTILSGRVTLGGGVRLQ